MENITSKNNDKVKLAVSLRDSAQSRKNQGLFFLEGARLCLDAAESGADILQFFFTAKSEKKFEKYVSAVCAKAKQCYIISEEVSEKMSDTQSPQGLFCICREKQNETEIKKDGKYILLENIQDPSNLGAISRSAEALGLDALIVSGGCDIYNPKALRSSMGAFFRLGVINCPDIISFINKVKNNGMTVVASTPSAEAVPITEVDFSKGVICIVGNEGSGVTKETMESADVTATIPMAGRAESLNASTAAAILIWEMMRRGS